ncbi:hypothetical protein MSAN_01111700 [Mycena sanguinolenta]|uniref:Uncharacterized protein n=1 Tax=Mycena sanguinolenta TaxID=230812 RepID=A0A8H6YKR9_9AGAR|nr:hypothetical protein MSAN_01111700 [Mycena sanguinolenta]
MASSATQSTHSMNASTSSASPPCLSTASSCGVPSPGTLYLFTFLATVVLLALIAGGIVMRSVHLRRRQRELASNRTGRSIQPEPNLKSKPRIFDVRLGDAVTENELQRWEFIMPLAAVTARAQAPRSTPEPSYPHPSSAAVMRALGTVLDAARILSRRGRILHHANVPVPIETPMLTPCCEKESNLRTDIVYIITMPEDLRLVQPTCHDGEHKMPLLEFGVIAIDVVGTAGGLYLSFGPDEGEKAQEHNVDFIGPTQRF